MKHFSIFIIYITIYTAVSAQTSYHKYPSISTIPFSVIDAHTYEENNIKSTIRKVAEYQIEKYGEDIPTKNWLAGTFFSSFVAAYNVTGDNWYLDKAYAWGEKSEWDIHRPINADDICPAQTYLDIYFVKKDPKIFKTLHEKISVYFNRKEIFPGEKNSNQKTNLPLTGRNTWSWCDALYMAPPVYARLGKATGDKRYYEMLHRLYWDSVDFLYAPDQKLFHRNDKIKTEKDRTPNGKKIYWARGNGWVFAGLARLIEYLPDNDPIKEKYIKLFQDMAYSLAKYQLEDGLWRTRLNDPEWITTKETSGSAFYIYGMAKGIKEGWLPKEYFISTVLKGWTGLMSCVTPYGKLGYSQIVAGSPHEVRPHDNVDYAAGAFILAGTEILKINAMSEMNLLIDNTFIPRVVVRDGFWPTYNKNSVITHRNCFFTSYIKHDGTGALTAFNFNKHPNVSAYARKELKLFSKENGFPEFTPSIFPLHKDTIQVTYAKAKNNYTLLSQNIYLPIWKPMEKKGLKESNTINKNADCLQNWRNCFENNDIPLINLLSNNDTLFTVKKQKKNIQVAYTSIEGNKHNYYLASLKQNKWKKELLCSFSNDKKSDNNIKGSITLHPNKQEVIISSAFHPKTKQPLPNGLYQLFSGEKINKIWQWKQLTFNPVHNQFHPIITDGQNHALFWMSGQKINEKEYHTDIMMSSKF